MFWGSQRFYQWIGQKILSCFHVKHFEIDPTVPKLDIVKCKGLWFESRQFQTIFGRNFLRNVLGLSEVLPMDWQKILSCFHVKHFEIDPKVPKLDTVKCKVCGSSPDSSKQYLVSLSPSNKALLVPILAQGAHCYLT